MAIFKQDQEEIVLTRAEIIETILDIVYDDYEDWHSIEFKNGAYDILLIKTFKKITTKFINPGSPNPLHKEKEEEVQCVVAITIDTSHKLDQDKIFAKTRSWTSHHIISDNVKSVIRALKELDKEHS
jgi:hypothetical protein